MTNLTDLAVDALTIGAQTMPEPTAQAMTASGDILIKNGVVTLSKAAAPLAATLAAPIAGTDDFKRLVIVNLGDAGQAHTVAPVGGLGGGVATATSATTVGDTLELIALGGLWYIAGFHQWTFA